MDATRQIEPERHRPASGLLWAALAPLRGLGDGVFTPALFGRHAARDIRER
jgi:hypothetical protein